MKDPAERNAVSADFQTLLSSFAPGIAILERSVKIDFLWQSDEGRGNH
jgi:hypothetical protein